MRPALLVALLVALPARADVAAVDSGAPRAIGEHRVENEFILSVPADQEEAVWAFFQRRYGPGEGSILPALGEGFSATFSDEAFVDRYFDTPDLVVLRQEGGVRHRTRRNLGDATDRKHGRQLVQLKLQRPGDEDVNRSEVKFDVDPPKDARDALDGHPLLGLVSRDDRPRLVRTLAAVDIDGTKLQETLTIEQRRRRAYVSRGGRPFATLTLDHVTSSFGPCTVEFVGLDIELNEVAYTAASGRQRGDMEALSRRLLDDLLAAFPGLTQDQTPKYNRVFAAFEERLPRFRFLVVHGSTLGTAAILGLPLLLFAGYELARLARRRRRRPLRSS